MRLDQWLVKTNKVRSRTQAEELIKRGEVQILVNSAWKVVTKPAHKVEDHVLEDHIKIESDISKFVARSGYKLEKALEHLNLMVAGKRCVDVGQSTGGFTQVLIDQEADLVVGLDVGKDQLCSQFKSHLKVKCFENLDIRTAAEHPELKALAPFDLAVVDVSFISLTLVLNPILNILRQDAVILALVKPQFELSSSQLDRRGLVKGEDLLLEVEKKIEDFIAEDQRLQILDYFPSALPGKEGNLEFFAYIRTNY